MMAGRALLPVEHCRVVHPARPGVGLVVRLDAEAEDDEVTVRWFRPERMENVKAGELVPAFETGTDVREHSPHVVARRALGRGTLVALRELGGGVQACVQFRADGRLRWVPWQHLSMTHGPAERFVLDHAPDEGGAERVRLRVLGELLTRWYARTGSLPRADDEAAAREIAIVRRLLEEERPNRLLTGVAGTNRAPELLRLLAALDGGGRARRVLFVVHERALERWLELLRAGTGFEGFVASHDSDSPEDDGGTMHVVVTHERGIRTGWLERSGTWDLVVVDEAHRLPLDESDASGCGGSCDALRRATGSLLLITSAPHAGRRDRLRALLRLVRPDEVGQLDEILDDPARLESLVIAESSGRAFGVDSDESPPGVVFHRVNAKLGADEREFHTALLGWTRRLLEESRRTGDIRRFSLRELSRFHRRLAAGSLDAVHAALRHRLQGLVPGSVEGSVPHESLLEDAHGLRILAMELTEVEAAFDGEADSLLALVERADALTGVDSKTARLLSLIEVLLERGVGPIVVATGLRTVAEQVRDAFDVRFGGDAPLSIVIDGDPLRALPEGCRTLVNVDLPLDPVRMAERVRPFVGPAGPSRAEVFDLCVDERPDERAMVDLHVALRGAASQLAAVQGVSDAVVENEWIAHLGTTDDLRAAMRRVRMRDDDGPDLRRAVAEACEGSREWARLSRHATRPEPDEPSTTVPLTPAHVESFFYSMCRQVGATVICSVDRPGLIRVVLDARGREMAGFAERFTAVAFDPAVVDANEDISSVDMTSDLVRALLRFATSERFDEDHARVAALEARAFVAARLRWHDDVGRRRCEEVRVLAEDDHGRWTDDPVAVAAWLSSEATDGNATSDGTRVAGAAASMEKARQALDAALEAGATRHLHPADLEILAIASRAPRKT